MLNRALQTLMWVGFRCLRLGPGLLTITIETLFSTFQRLLLGIKETRLVTSATLYQRKRKSYANSVLIDHVITAVKRPDAFLFLILMQRVISLEAIYAKSVIVSFQSEMQHLIGAKHYQLAMNLQKTHRNKLMLQMKNLNIKRG